MGLCKYYLFSLLAPDVSFLHDTVCSLKVETTPAQLVQSMLCHYWSVFSRTGISAALYSLSKSLIIIDPTCSFRVCVLKTIPCMPTSSAVYWRPQRRSASDLYVLTLTCLAILPCWRCGETLSPMWRRVACPPSVALNIPYSLCSIEMYEVFCNAPWEMNSFISRFLYVWRGTVRCCRVFKHSHSSF